MADGTPVTYEDLTDELKKKYDEVKAILEADLIGSFHRTRSHGIRWKGFSLTRSMEWTCPSRRRTHQVLRQEIGYMPRYSFNVNMVELGHRLIRVETRAAALIAKIRKKLLHAIGPDTAKRSW
ncbi:hypothetical protein QYE76_068743 [Lolium multiflorum]|uniref:Uncharacterized protein n=1 Tax=Lolium multiflorum TaxID=4521 RepID=A0AAD8SGT1_LOLMU|nr:hypothetical protein QYE76_068743 [Lolium multiflorum]